VKRLQTTFLLGAVAACLAFAPFASADLITNGDFETGDFTGWTVFTTANGTVSGGAVTSFDTTGAGASLAAQFNVGDVNYTGNQEGGGISQVFDLASDGTVDFSADVATDSSTFNNVSGGVYSLLVDGTTYDSYNSGPVNFDVYRDTLTASVGLTAGDHTLEILITRPYVAYEGGTPTQYVDNVTAAEEASTPEPATLAMLGLGLSAIGLLRKRR
jgi:hypothetical protein